MILMFVSFMVMVVVGVPIAFALIGATLLAIAWEGMSPIIVSQMIVEGLLPFPILAIPLFYMVGLAANQGGMVDTLIALSMRFIGRVKGSLGYVNILSSMFFGGVSGSSAADTASIGAVMIPQMVKQRYPVPVAVAITACSSTMGNIIPPSILLVVYGSFGNLSVAALFLGGIIPGIMLGLGQMALWRLLVSRYDLDETVGVTGMVDTNNRSLLQAILLMAVPLIILSGIVFGVFTATESAAIALLYIFLLHITFRTMSLRDYVRLFMDSGRFVALPLIMTAAAACFAWMFAYYDAPAEVAQYVSGVADSPLAAILIVVGVFLVIGMVIDTLPAIIMFLPIIQALAAANGIDQVHMGVIVVLTCAIGLVTPPFGVCLLIATRISNASVLKVLPMTLLFLTVSLLVIALCILFPQLILFLPSLLL
ncbi:MAG: TRAP transporter large permease [Aquamicrobium sp.]|uniref:TRAP transporter large permease n=1 Tax=Aquamicrobium sp. TaxID=1872579 RepID=UPI00349ED7E1|nr:TRAP transporter large permease [Aquamicrobium sp.]MCO5158568.1 TRAP transporter large permease [Aquamicrobium sp.]